MIEAQNQDGDFIAAEEGNRNNSTSTVRQPRSNPPSLSLGHLKRPQSSQDLRKKIAPSANNFDSLLTVRRDQIKPPIVMQTNRTNFQPRNPVVSQPRIITHCSSQQSFSLATLCNQIFTQTNNSPAKEAQPPVFIDVGCQTCQSQQQDAILQKRLDFAEAEAKQLKAQLLLVNQWLCMEMEQYEANESQGPEPLFDALEKRFKRAAELRSFYTTQYEGHVK